MFPPTKRAVNFGELDALQPFEEGFELGEEGGLTILRAAGLSCIALQGGSRWQALST